MEKRAVVLILALAAVLGLAACGKSPSANAGPVKIATKPMTEQYILGEMLGLIIEDAGYEVEITKGIGGGTNNIQPAMEKGEFDLYPEYTSSGWVMVLDHDAVGMDDTEMFDSLKSEYQDKFQMTWVGLYGFNNTFTIAVREDVAQQYHLKTTSDLAAVAGELNFGVNDIDIGLKYQALQNGDIDVTNAFTTDAQLGNQSVRLVTLEDDKHLQVNYFCSTVVRQDALEKYPGLEDALMKMDGLLSDSEMAHLNYLVEVEGADEKDVARDFLMEKGVLKG